MKKQKELQKRNIQVMNQIKKLKKDYIVKDLMFQNIQVIHMKIKYLRMTKEEQKQALEDYKNSSEVASEVVKRIKRVRIISCIGLIYGIALSIFNVITSAHFVDYISSGVTIIACLLLFIKSKEILIGKVNEYIVTNIRNKQKEERKKEEKKAKKNKEII